MARLRLAWVLFNEAVSTRTRSFAALNPSSPSAPDKTIRRPFAWTSSITRSNIVAQSPGRSTTEGTLHGRTVRPHPLRLASAASREVRGVHRARLRSRVWPSPVARQGWVRGRHAVPRARHRSAPGHRRPRAPDPQHHPDLDRRSSTRYRASRSRGSRRPTGAG
jgi:hypothetical protein